MNNQWKRVRLLSVNRWFRADVAEVRATLGIPEDGFSDETAASEYANALYYAPNGVLVPVDPTTGDPLVTIPTIQASYDVRGPSPLLWRWGIGKRRVTGGSPRFPSEDFGRLSDDPIDQHVMGLVLRYRLPNADFVKRAIREFILSGNKDCLDIAPAGGGIGIGVAPDTTDEALIVTLSGVPPGITRKDWVALHSILRDLIGEQPAYREARQFEFHHRFYELVKVKGLSLAAAEKTWIDESDEPLPDYWTDAALRQAFARLEKLMKPTEP